MLRRGCATRPALLVLVPRAAAPPRPQDDTKDHHEQLLPARNRFRAGSLHRRTDRCQAGGRHRSAQSLAPPAAHRRPARGGAAEEHPHDRADRRRQDRDLAAPRQACRRALPEGRGHQVHRGRLRRPRRRQHRPRPGRDRHDPGARRQAPPGAGTRGEGSRGTRHRRIGRRVFVTRHAGKLSPQAAQQRAQRQGDRDPRRRRQGWRPADVRAAGPAGKLGRHDQHRRDARQGARRRRRQAAQGDGEGQLCPADSGGERQAARQRPDHHRGPARGRGQRHRVSRRDRQDLLPQRGRPHRRRRQPRGRAARPAAAHRRHDRLDEVRPREDRPYPVHRIGRLPRRRSRRICCPSCRAACRSGSSSSHWRARTSGASSPSRRPA